MRVLNIARQLRSGSLSGGTAQSPPGPAGRGLRWTLLSLAALLPAAIVWAPGLIPAAQAAPHSSQVAYVTDFGLGVSDPSFLGSSIFVNAIDGTPPAGDNYTTPSGTATHFTDVPASTIDTNGLAAISSFDTVMLYEVCDIASHPNLISALNTYLSEGLGKVVVYDGDRCAPTEAGTPDYSTFLFPFTTSNPGPDGSEQALTFVEPEPAPATLNNGIAVGDGLGTDAVGDSNTFTSNAGGWCAGQEGPNALGVTGIQVAYARTGNGGLAIYNGHDNWFTFGANSFDKKIFDNILDQPVNPDSLPCGVPVTGIKLAPLTSTNPVGTSHTVTATVTNNSGAPVPGVTVTFTVQSGPNAGRTGTAVTDANGNASFTYTDTGGAGTDTIVATFKDATGSTHMSNTVTKTWTSVVSPPSCALTAVVAGPPKQIQVTVQASGGLQSIQVTRSTNATTTVPTFTTGTTSPEIVTATKVNQSLAAELSLKITDVSGNTTTCDPVMTTVLAKGSPQVFTGLRRSVSFIQILDGVRGLHTLVVTVNGKTFDVRLRNGMSQSLDVSKAMHAGANGIALSGRGPRGSSADIVIRD